MNTQLIILETPNHYINYTTLRDLFVFREKLLNNMKKMSIQKIQQLTFINDNTQAINIFRNTNAKDNATCCSELSKQRVDIATKIALNQTNICFDNQRTNFENILNETIEVNINNTLKIR